MNGWLHCTHTIQLQVNSVSQSKTDQHTTGVMSVPHSWDVECRKTDGRSTGGTLLLNFYLCCNCVPGQSEIRHEFSNGYWGYLGLTPQCCCWWKVLLVTIFDEILQNWKKKMKPKTAISVTFVFKGLSAIVSIFIHWYMAIATLFFSVELNREAGKGCRSCLHTQQDFVRRLQHYNCVQHHPCLFFLCSTSFCAL